MGPYFTVANRVKWTSIPSLQIPLTKQKIGFDPTLQSNTNWVQPNPKIWVGLTRLQSKHMLRLRVNGEKNASISTY